MIRRILLTAALAIGFTSVGVAPAQAGEACGVVVSCVTNYYQNGTYSTVVGQRFVDCDGTVTRWGTVTVWKNVMDEPCV